jgi:hypothetical protein
MYFEDDFLINSVPFLLKCIRIQKAMFLVKHQRDKAVPDM